MRQDVFKAAIICIMMFILVWLHPHNAQAKDNTSAKVMASSLNVRSAPDLQSSIVGSLKQNEVVAVSKESYGWIKIKSGRTVGWVAGQYLNKLEGNQSDKPAKAASAKNTS